MSDWDEVADLARRLGDAEAERDAWKESAEENTALMLKMANERDEARRLLEISRAFTVTLATDTTEWRGLRGETP